MPTPTAQLLSRTTYATDGTTLNWDFSFSGGYLLPAHVKAFTEVPATGQRTEITVTEPMLIGPYQLRITPALTSGLNLTIYRDTPKDLPMVDFTDESGFSEVALDTNAKQAVFIAAETTDAVNTSSSFEAEQAASQAATAASEAATAASEALVSANSALASANAAVATPVAAPTTSAASKVTPVDADYMPIVDSAAAFVLKKLTWANLKAALTSVFATAGVNSNITKLTGLNAWRSGEVIQELLFTDNGSTTTNTVTYANLTVSVKSITPKSATSSIYVFVTALGGVNTLAATNTIGYFQLYEETLGLFGPTPSAQAPSGSGGTGVFLPMAVAAVYANTTLASKSFSLRGKTSHAGALAQATLMVWTLREVQN